MKKTALLTASLLAGFAASAQIAITSTTLTYSQDFNALSDDTSSFSNVLPAGWAIGETGNGSANDGKYRVGNGSKNNGDVYSFGAAGNTERALGSIASGSLKPAYGATFMNNTGTTITGFTLTYTGEQWRMGQDTMHLDSLVFQYSTVAFGVNDSTATAGWVNETSLMLNSVQTFGTLGPLDGNDSANRTTVTGTLTFPTPIPDGGSFIVRWKDIDIKGADDGLAIDDVTFTFTTGPTSVAHLNQAATQLTVLGQPANGHISLGFTLQQAGQLHIEVLDLNGRVLHHERIQAQSGAQQYQISHLNLPAGAYIIRINNGKEAGVVKTTLR